MSFNRKSFGLLIILLLSCNVYAVNNDFSAFNADNDVTITDGTEDSNVDTVLNNKFTSSRNYKSFQEVSTVLKNLNINTVVASQSSQSIPSQGVSIKTSGTIQDYVNRVANQFGYKWSFNNTNNTVTFTAINPVIIANTAITKSEVNASNAITAKQKSATTLANKNDSITGGGLTSSLASNSVWVLDPEKDRTVRDGIAKWSKQAGWQLVWKGAFDMPVEAQVKIPGSFEYAINEICRASQATGKQLIAEMHDKNKVVVIYTSGIR